MRALLLLIVGVILGAVLVTRWEARPPAGAALPSASDVRVSLSDGYLSRLIEERASGNGIIAVTDVQVRSAPSALTVRADASLGPLTAPITVELQPVVVGGDVQERIIATQVGAVPIPAPLTGLVAGSINASLRHILGANATVTGVRVTPRGLDITADYS